MFKKYQSNKGKVPVFIKSGGGCDFTGNHLQKHRWYRKTALLILDVVFYYLAYSYRKCTAVQGTGEK